ncbi:hypothetical protein GCM10010149_14080 [Nonomuraea roseoviolacea subsp. roseoviolacea]|uniref:DUF4333 domain-containing protein n=1 Tax=Nonomuraea roseoviolacea subsp. carminata TaxID=160689 RepID=A0ABT1KBF1_9ACTN|nr:hypothetical protein [Nonomuraea roseoviolacea]MCP2351348.1 hypothetical protein [Nonomuraea roseoviolacea subsp. carminata]
MKPLRPVAAFLTQFVIASVALAGAGAAVVVLGVLSYGCGAEEDRLTEALAAQDVLQRRPAGVQPAGPRATSCEDDDLWVNVVQVYRLPPARVDVRGFYREAATGDGWRPGEEAGAEDVCYTKVIDGVDVGMELSMEDRADTYTVSLSSSTELSGGQC